MAEKILYKNKSWIIPNNPDIGFIVGEGIDTDVTPTVAQIGGLGIAPGANVGDGIAMFEATNGTSLKYAGLDKVNPRSIILSGVMMQQFMGWNEAAELIINGIEKTFLAKTVTYDLERQMTGATLLK